MAAATDASGPVVTAAAVSALALVPFIVAGDVAGNELLYAAAPVLLAGLVAATLLNTLVLSAACLWFGPARAPGRDGPPRPAGRAAAAAGAGGPRGPAGGRPAGEPGQLGKGARPVHRFSRRPSLSAVLALAIVFALAALAGCASTSAGDDQPPPAPGWNGPDRTAPSAWC